MNILIGLPAMAVLFLTITVFKWETKKCMDL